MTRTQARSMLSDPVLSAALSFDAPDVREKLVKDRIADSPAEADLLFTEAKRFIVLCDVTTDLPCEMFSARVDEAWHQFILHTAEYTDFCRRYFGRYISHSPSNARQDSQSCDCTPSTGSMTFADFRDRYEALFDEPLPDVWYDVRSVGPSRRIIIDPDAEWTVGRRGGVVDVLDGSGHLVLTVDGLGAAALEFVLGAGAFYVRELPGGLTDAEKTALIEALVSTGLARCAA